LLSGPVAAGGGCAESPGGVVEGGNIPESVTLSVLQFTWRPQAWICMDLHCLSAARQKDTAKCGPLHSTSHWLKVMLLLNVCKCTGYQGGKAAHVVFERYRLQVGPTKGAPGLTMCRDLIVSSKLSYVGPLACPGKIHYSGTHFQAISLRLLLFVPTDVP
jgi:hypothetical protein